MSKRLQVIISAYSCEPEKGSEQGVGWNWALQVARYHDVIIMTRAKRKPVIEAYREKHGISNPRFEYVELPKWVLRLKKGNIGMNLYYFLWQIVSGIKAKKLVKKHKIDIAHHVSFMSLPRGTFVPFLGVKSVIGPIGGLQTVPKAAIPLIRSKLSEKIRNLNVRLMAWNPLMQLLARKCDRLVLANGSNTDYLPKAFQDKMTVGLQLGTTDIISQKRDQTVDGKVIIHWSGRLVDHKGFDILLLALAKLKREDPKLISNTRLIATAAGPLAQEYEAMIKDNNLEENVKITGWLTQDELQKIWSKTDIFAFTSLRETTGMSLQEAMIRSKPLIVMNNGGPAEMVTNDCGFKIECDSLKQIIEDYSAALKQLITRGDLRSKMGEMARVRAIEHYTWNTVGDRMAEIYESLYNSNNLET